MRKMKEGYMRLRRLTKMIRDYDLSIYASSMAFFLLLSFIPTFLLLFSFLPFTEITAKDIVEILRKALPKDLYGSMEKVIEQVYVKSLGRASMAALFSFWSSGKGMMAFIRSLNKIHKVKEERSYLHLRLIASFYTLIILFVYVVSLYLNIFGDIFYQKLINLGMNKYGVVLYFVRGKSAAVFAFLILLCLCFYTFLPSINVGLKNAVPGAVLSVLLWTLFSYGFSFYVQKIQHFTVYGSFGSILLFLLWLYFCSFILLIGCIFNCEITNIKNNDKIIKK